MGFKEYDMNVLSLFDGMSCGQITLERAGIKVDKYYASEIDKYAIQITQKNYPKTIQLGDVNDWIKWQLPRIDLILAGSPCQGFSLAGKQKAFDDPRSRLFFTFVNIKKKVAPKDFLLENVQMKKEYQDVITDRMGCEPVKINSSLVSAQNRIRSYWTSLGPIIQPEDKSLYLKDILECEEVLPVRLKSKCIRVGGKGSPVESKQEWDSPYVKLSKRGVYKKHQNKASCLTGGAHSGGNHSDMDLIGRPIEVGHATDIQGHDFLKRIYSVYGKSPTLTAIYGGNQHRKLALNDYEYRRYTPIECERLQTVPDNYTEGVSNTQRYKMLGNGWTVDVIVHILKGLK